MASYLEQTVYLNGAYLKGRDAKISIFDRGVLFADSVYEGLGVLDGQVVDLWNHLARLRRSLSQLNMPDPHTDEAYVAIFNRLIAANDMDEGFLYLQITRGVADRNYVYAQDLTPTVFAFVQVNPDPAAPPTGRSMRSHPDLRWKRRDIKTSNLLGQVMAKTAADQAGAYEALMIDDDGHVTEGGATSFFIVRDRVVVARPVDNSILHGITRQTMLRVAEEMGYDIAQRRFTLDEALSADEAFLTGASSYVEPVTEIDGQPIGSGAPGAYTLSLRARYLDAVRAGF
ncbi:MAG: D-amino acid aminotransferase [Pseudomonadota bacterium]